MARIPTVMVSSTFYDLRQVRSDLKQFIEDDLNYRPLLSEFNSFPVDPDIGTIENCRQRVEQDADIFVLVIGGRYGSTDDADARSITNIEYLTARRKGLPVYAFVEKSVQSIFPVWKNNQDGDFSNVVDDPRLFEFLEDVYSGKWVHQFEDAHEIISTLKKQLAYLVGKSLELRSSVNSVDDEDTRGLKGKSLRLVLEKPFSWEVRLFGTLMLEELRKASDLRRAYEKNIVTKPGPRLNETESFDWMRNQFPKLEKLIETYGKLINDTFHEAIGETGEVGDPQEIRFVAEKISEVYREALKWSQEVRALDVPECVQPPVDELSLFLSDVITKTESFGDELLKKVDEAERVYNEDGEAKIVLQLKFDIPNVDRFLKELDRAHFDC